MSKHAYRRVTEVVAQLDAGEPMSPAPVAALIRGLDDLAEKHLSADGAADHIRIGIAARLAAIELEPAVKAIETAIAGRGPGTVALMRALAKKKLLSACVQVLDLPEEMEVPRHPETDTARAPMPAEGRPTGEVLRNIATYHREHERYYTWYLTAEAADLFREANRLKAVATVWLDDPPAPPLRLASGDFSDHRFAPAGCNDLNALRAIGAIGVLFMEGEGEPAEIRALKGKLRGLGSAWQSTGDWLATKMAHAWLRESVVLRDDSLAAAEQRFGTIITNWCGSRQMALAGRCALLALQILERLDLRPASVRSDRRQAGRRLLDAAWTLDGVARVTGRSALDLSENERRWTSYLDLLATLPAVEVME